FEDRIVVAGHRQDAQQLRHRSGRASDLPFADGVGAVGSRQPAEFGHVGHRQRLADGLTEVLAKFLQFSSRHGFSVQIGFCEVRHTPGVTWGVYAAQQLPEEAIMRRLLESLTPDARQLYWKWVGGMFALYVVLMLTAAGVFIGHESSRKLAQQPVTTVAIDGKQRSISEVPAPLRQAARYN